MPAKARYHDQPRARGKHAEAGARSDFNGEQLQATTNMECRYYLARNPFGGLSRRPTSNLNYRMGCAGGKLSADKDMLPNRAI
eukprot:5572908-Pyramimonas_sp.AAC.1